MPYIYKITNGVTGKTYIGKTKFDAAKRFAEHIKESAQGADTLLYRSMRKHGPDVFTVEILETCTEDLLNEREIFYISTLAPEYNMTTGGEGGSTVHNKRWITDGNNNAYLLIGDPVPEGWRFGRSNCVFNDVEKQREFSKRGDRKKAGATNSERWKNGTNKFSDELLKKMSERSTGDNNPSKRIDVRSKISESRKNATRYTCIHCGRDFTAQMLSKWHNDRCKEKQ